jgi:hypothetical protein
MMRVHRGAGIGERELGRQRNRIVARAVVMRHEGENQVRVRGAAEKERVGDFLRGLVLGEHLGEAQPRRAVQDEADVRAVGHRLGEEDGRAVERVLERPLRDEEHGLVFIGARARKILDGERHEEQRRG